MDEFAQCRRRYESEAMAIGTGLSHMQVSRLLTVYQHEWRVCSSLLLFLLRFKSFIPTSLPFILCGGVGALKVIAFLVLGGCWV